MRHVVKRGWKRQLAFVVVAYGALAGIVASPASAQDTRWDSLLSNSYWYVPVPYLIAYASGNSSQTINTIPIGDQTLWALGTASHGVFSGSTEATFAIGSTAGAPTSASMQGIVTESGQIRIAFTSSGSPTVIGVGQMREISGVPLMQMQMITGSSFLITHWAYMAPYNPAVFTPPSPTQYVTANVLSPEWRWTAGTTWRVASQMLFGTAAPGTFKITDYSSGYYWGIGAAPQGSAVGNFTVLGSMTPEGNVLFSLLGGDTLSSLNGQITGDATTGAMVLRPYDLSGPTGTPTLADIMPVSTIAAGQTYFLSNVGTTVIPAFAGGTLQVDMAVGTYAQNFSVDGSITNRLDQRGNAARLTGVLSDAAPGTPGNLTIANSDIGGRITFAGANTYSGLTTVEAGATLSVDGSIVSPVSVSGMLGGSGTVGTTQINSGGTLSPGNSIGTLTVNGNLAFGAGSTYAVEASPGAVDRTNVSGTATLAGTLRASFARGTYSARTYTLLSATGGRTGTFGTFSTAGLPGGFQTNLSYTSTDVMLNLTAALGGGLALSSNQGNVANALNTSFNSGNSLSSGLYGLFSMSGPPLANALNSLSGEAQTGAQTAAFTFGNQFLNTVLGSTGSGGLGGSLQQAVQYASLDANEAGPEPRRLRGWLAGFGGYGWLDGASGSSSVQTTTQGLAMGADWTFDGGTLGVAVASGSSNWFLASGLGSGLGNVLQIGLYGRTGAGPLYAAVAGGWGVHGVSTNRSVGFLGDFMSANYTVNTWSGRAEAGYRIALGDHRLTPFVAVQGQAANLPGFCETSRTGSGAALCFNANTATSLRSELGIEGDANLGTVLGSKARLQARLAWAHEYETTGTATAWFQSLPGSSFSVSGTPLPANVGLVRVLSDFELDQIWSLRLQGDAEFAGNYGSLAGTARIAARW
jgi:autotransporter-associated beta strand protein